MSGMLGQILGGFMGGGQQGASSPLAAILQDVMAGRGAGQGGIAGLISRFQSAGLGQQAQSWVTTGPNAPITASDVGQVFTPEQIAGWAAQAGTTPEAMQQVLAQALPHVVDHMTPDGQVPHPSTDTSGMLMRLLGGGAR